MPILNLTIHIPDEIDLGPNDNLLLLLRDAVKEFAGTRYPADRYVTERYATPGTKMRDLTYGEKGSASFATKVAEVERRARIAYTMEFRELVKRERGA